MKTRLLHLWELLTTSFWFLPSVLIAGAAAVSFLLLEVDENWGMELMNRASWLEKISPEGARVLLGTLAAASLTLMAMSFSATIVSLTLAASQFGPRLLRNFMRSATNQATLGMLLATFVFSLLVLRSIRSNGEVFVPQFSTLAAFLLMLASLAFFIRFIHRLSTSIQAEHVVADVLDELEAMIADAFPDTETESATPKIENPCSSDDSKRAVVCYQGPRAGYLQAIEHERLLEFANAQACCVHVTIRPGDFVLKGEAIASIENRSCDSNATFDEEISEAFLVGDHRTPEQDHLYGIRQLVEIALRALSPSINDPFTATHCIHGLGVALARIGASPDMPEFLVNEKNEPRVRLNVHSYDEVVEGAFGLLKGPASEHPEIALTVVECLTRVAAICQRDTHCRQLDSAAKYFAELLSNQRISDLQEKRLERAVEELDKRCNGDRCDSENGSKEGSA